MFKHNYASLLSNQDKARLSWDKAININRFISEVQSNGRVAFWCFMLCVSMWIKILIFFTIDPRRPFKWIEFCVASQTVGFTPRFEKNDRVIKSLLTATWAKVCWFKLNNAQLSLNEFLLAPFHVLREHFSQIFFYDNVYKQYKTIF